MLASMMAKAEGSLPLKYRRKSTWAGNSVKIEPVEISIDSLEQG
jgi:hypothetical protein